MASPTPSAGTRQPPTESASPDSLYRAVLQNYRFGPPTCSDASEAAGGGRRSCGWRELALLGLQHGERVAGRVFDGRVDSVELVRGLAPKLDALGGEVGVSSPAVVALEHPGAQAACGQ